MDFDITPALRHAFDIRLDFGYRRRFGSLPWGGGHGYTGIDGGTTDGPLLSGRVVPHSGGDFPFFRSDGVIEFTADYLLEAADGTLIRMANRGYKADDKDVAASGSPGFPAPQGMRFAPTFQVERGPHDWLTRTVIIGIGIRKTSPDHSIFRYFAWL